MPITSLKPYNTFRVEAFTEQLTGIESEQQLLDLLYQGLKPDLILGGGSNILFSGKKIPIVWKNNITGKKILEENEETALVEAGGGEDWHELVIWTLDRHLGGIENLSLIPGTVGAAPIQNIGAYGVELKDVFHSLDAVDLQNQSVHTFYKEDCAFDYRNSFFKQHKGRFFITKVRLELSKHPQVNISYGAIADVLAEKGIQSPGIRDVSQAVVQIRQSKLPQPEQIGNAGSFFKNPIIDEVHFRRLRQAYPKLVFYPAERGSWKVPAGWLIEQCGFKGKREGRVGCYAHQALVIVNFGGATGSEVLAWAEKIEQAVYERFGIHLEREINVI